MASLFGKLTDLARSPQAQKVITQASRKAQQLAKDPATRAKIDQGTARVRAEVAKRRGGAVPTSPPPSATPSASPSPTTTADDVTPG